MAAERKPTAPVAIKQPFSDELAEKVVLRQTEADVPAHEDGLGGDVAEAVEREEVDSRAETNTASTTETTETTAPTGTHTHTVADTTANTTPALATLQNKPRPLPSAHFRNALNTGASGPKLEPQIRDIKYATLWSRFVANLFDSCVAGLIGAITLMLVIYIAPANTIEPIFGSNCFSEIGPAVEPPSASACSAF